MSKAERQARKQTKEERWREQYEDGVAQRNESRERREAERETVLEYHRRHSGEYLYGIYRWVRFGGIVLVILLILTFLFAVIGIGYGSGV